MTVSFRRKALGLSATVAIGALALTGCSGFTSTSAGAGGGVDSITVALVAEPGLVDGVVELGLDVGVCLEPGHQHPPLNGVPIANRSSVVRVPSDRTNVQRPSSHETVTVIEPLSDGLSSPSLTRAVPIDAVTESVSADSTK